MSGLAILETTVDGAEKARALGKAALGARLAACVQIAPIRSLYIWKDELCESDEHLLRIKLRAEDYDALATLVRSLHSYETPEILRINVAVVDASYLDWARAATRKP